MRHWKRWLLLLPALVVIGAIAYAYVPKPAVVDVATVTVGPMAVTVPADGRTRVKDRYVISAPAAGNLLRLELRTGDTVDPSTVIARIVPADVPLLDVSSRAVAEARVGAARASAEEALAAIERARATEELARRQSETQTQLANHGAAPPRDAEIAALELRSRTADVQSAHFAARVADYELASARAALERLEAPTSARGQRHSIDVLGPVHGRVLRVIHESGGVVAAGAALLEVGDPAALEIVADVLTRDAVQVHEGAAVEIDDWGGERPLRGRVRLVEPSAFTKMSALGVEEQRVNVVIDLEEPPEALTAVGDGYQLTAQITVWQQDAVMQIPEGALFRDHESWAVFAVQNGRAMLRRVTVGHQNGVRAEVLHGLAVGEHVIVHPDERTTTGALVRAQ